MAGKLNKTKDKYNIHVAWYYSPSMIETEFKCRPTQSHTINHLHFENFKSSNCLYATNHIETIKLTSIRDKVLVLPRSSYSELKSLQKRPKVLDADQFNSSLQDYDWMDDIREEYDERVYFTGGIFKRESKTLTRLGEIVYQKHVFITL